MTAFYTKCDSCGREIQVHPTNYVSPTKRVCIPCQDVERFLATLPIEREELIDRLESLKKNGPSREQWGICYNLAYGYHGQAIATTFYDVVSYMAKFWPKSRGGAYPIAGIEEPRYGRWKGERGQLRLELIDFIIKELKKVEKGEDSK